METFISILCLIFLGYIFYKIFFNPMTSFKFVLKLFLWLGLGLAAFMAIYYLMLYHA